jgi:hypothetical protein
LNIKWDEVGIEASEVGFVSNFVPCIRVPSMPLRTIKQNKIEENSKKYLVKANLFCKTSDIELMSWSVTPIDCCYDDHDGVFISPIIIICC